MSNQTAPRAYTGILRPNARKHELLSNTLTFLDRGSDTFFDFFISFFGGMTPKMCGDEQIVCATNWFRSMSIEPEMILTEKQMLERFTQYFGEQPNDLVKEFLSAPLGEGCFWVDCRKKFNDLQSALCTTNLLVDLNSFLIELGIIPTKNKTKNKKEKEKCKWKGATTTGWNVASFMFGDGEKEDRDKKCEILQHLIDQIDLAECYEDVQSLLLEFTGVGPDEFQRKDVWGSGAPGLVVKIAKGIFPKKEFDSEYLKKKFIEILKSKQKVILLPNKQAIFSHLRSIIGDYDVHSWSQMINVSLPCITSRNTRNCNFAEEKLQLKSSLSDCSEQAVELLNAFHESEWNNSDIEFVITPQNLGGKYGFIRISNFWNEHEDEEDVLESGIDDLLQECKSSDSKEPHLDVLRYVYSIRKEVPSEEIYKASKHNRTLDKYNHHKVHPTVRGNPFYTVGKSALRGSVIPPNKSLGKTPAIWVEIQLLDNGEWKPHHIPFFNSRFFEEAYGLTNSDEFVPLRTKHFGTDLTKRNLPPLSVSTMPQNENESKNNYVKAQRRIQRLSDDIPNVKWPEKVGFCFREENGNFKIAVNFKVPLPEIANDISHCERIFGLDQNQSVNHTYSVYEIADKSEPDVIYYLGHYFRKVETGKVVSMTKATHTSEAIDQLSYEGVGKGSNLFDNWVNDRKTFVDSIGVKAVSQEFERVLLCESLYKFNRAYLVLLKKIISGKIRRGKSVIDFGENISDSMRDEIIEMCIGKGSPMRLSSLSQSSISSIGNLKSVVDQFIARKLNDKEIEKTKETQQQIEPRLFEFLEAINAKRVNKRKEKVNRSLSFIVAKAIEHNVKLISCESELNIAETGNSKAKNSANMDWCARALAKSIETACPLYGIMFFGINPRSTSHQNPFVYFKGSSAPNAMNPRFGKFNFVPEHLFNKLKKYANSTDKGTAVYYRHGVEKFVSHHGLGSDWQELTLEEFNDILFTSYEGEEILIPLRGGRYYLATHPVTTDCTEVNYNGENLFLCDSDEVAAVNVMMSGFERFIARKNKATSRKVAND